MAGFDDRQPGQLSVVCQLIVDAAPVDAHRVSLRWGHVRMSHTYRRRLAGGRLREALAIQTSDAQMPGLPMLAALIRAASIPVSRVPVSQW